MAGLGSPLAAVASALFAAPGAAIAGAVGAIRRQTSRGLVAGLVAGFLVALYPCVALTLYDDTSWPYSLLILGGGPFFGVVFTGPMIAWLVGPDDPTGCR
jgi:hypothetical protein